MAARGECKLLMLRDGRDFVILGVATLLGEGEGAQLQGQEDCGGARHYDCDLVRAEDTG
jgi:hypothetical protein